MTGGDTSARRAEPADAGSSDAGSPEVVAEALHGGYAAVLIDRRDGGGARLELLTRTDEGQWRIRARGDDEAVSDGAVMAVWDAEHHRIVIGQVTEDRDGAPLEAPRRRPNRGLVLMWLVFQGGLLWPAAAGRYVWEGPAPGLAFLTFQALIITTIAGLILRSLVRLWRDRATEPSRAYAGALALAAMVFLLYARGPFLVDDGLATKPVGVLALILVVNLAALSARELVRLRRRHRPSAG